MKKYLLKAINSNKVVDFDNTVLFNDSFTEVSEKIYYKALKSNMKFQFRVIEESIEEPTEGLIKEPVKEKAVKKKAVKKKTVRKKAVKKKVKN